MESENPMTTDALRLVTRRHFFGQCAVGLGAVALGELLSASGALADTPTTSGAPATANGAPDLASAADPMTPRPGHFPARIKSVIYLFMAGGPSQLELFDYKPKLQELTGQPIPQSFIEGRRFAFMDSFAAQTPKLLGTVRKFERHGSCGAWVSELMPHTAGVVDDLCFIKTLATDQINHAPAKLFMNTGSGRFGRPSMGAWTTYGIGSEARDLPGFVVLQSGPRGPRGGSPLWGSGFLPSAYQGVPFRSGGDPILNISNPEGIDAAAQRRTIDALAKLNGHHLDQTGDDEIATRIASYEMAYRLQTSAPELMNLAGESQATMDEYGAEPGAASFANNCLLARRLVERGVRFVQLYHTNWDHHGGKTENLETALEKTCAEVDRAGAALVADLKQRGLLDQTLVIWGGEFGRTPMGEIRETVGRNHHIDCSTVWLAGGGVKPGFTLGQTDELGFAPVEDRVHVHDLHATILYQLGIDHTRLTYRFQGRNFRLTDVAGEVIQKILS